MQLPHSMTSATPAERIQAADDFRTRYPYSAAADISLLLSETPLPPEARQRIASRTSTCLGARDSQMRILGDSSVDIDRFYPDQLPVSPTTEETIDTFLSTYGSKADSRETEILERAMFAPGATFEAEFAASAPSGASMPDDATSRGIDSFLGAREESPAPSTRNVKRRSASKSSSDTTLTESLAKVMIKNGNYTKALEIISDLSLSNPQKMIYFADQIRFLKKLIINQKYKK